MRGSPYRRCSAIPPSLVPPPLKNGERGADGVEGAPMSADLWKHQAAERALGYLEDGMTVGLGSGSTSAKFVDLVGERVKAGLRITGVPTSEATRAQAERLGIPLTTLDDGAVPRSHRRWRRRARRRAAAHQGRRRRAAAREDRGNGVRAHGRHRRRLQARLRTLGNFPLPVEVVRFGLVATRNMVAALCRRGRLRGRDQAAPRQGRRAVRHRRRQLSPRLRVRPHRQAGDAGRCAEARARRGRERPVPRHRRRRHRRRARAASSCSSATVRRKSH